MASRYEYRYSFKMGNEQEMNPLLVDKSDLGNGLKGYAFEIRTNYTVKTRLGGVQVEEHIDSETFEAFTYVHRGNPVRDELMLSYRTSGWLEECWMTAEQIRAFNASALAFARSLEARPENAGLTLIPVVVDFLVCTVQPEHESIEGAVRSLPRLFEAASCCWSSSSSSLPSPTRPAYALFA